MPEVICAQSIHPEGMKILSEGTSTHVASDPSDDTVAREGADAKALVVRLTKVTASLMDKMPNLKIIGRHGIGVDNIDVEAATKRGILVINVPGEMAQAVAEHAITMLLCLKKNIISSDRAVRAGRYQDRDSLRGGEMMGKTLGVIGLGRIGRIVTEIAQAFKMNILGYDPFLPLDVKLAGVTRVAHLNDALTTADMIVVCVPLTPETDNLFNKATFALMKKGALIVNVSRGGILNEDDLYEALVSGQIGGAGLDVFREEPPDHTHPLFTHPRVVLTPHNAGMTSESVIRMSTTLATDVITALKGEMPRNPVNPDAWKNKK